VPAKSVSPVAILGAGLAGLTAANFLYRQGVPVVVFEAGKQVAGLAASFQEDGFTYDFGAHFITNRLAGAVGIAKQCRDVPYYGESVYLNARHYSYPMGLLCDPKFLGSAVTGRLSGTRNRRPPANLKEHFSDLYGKALAQEVAIPLAEAWSGVSAEQLAPSVAEKLPLGIAKIIYLRLMSRVTGRAIAIGYGKERPSSTEVWHVYPEGGTSLLCHKLAEPLKNCLHVESRVESIFVASDRAVGVRVNGIDYPASAVISTAPCSVLPKLITGTHKLDFLSRFRFRPMTFVLLRLEGRNLLKDAVIWTPEARFPFFRLTETPVSMPWLAPEGKTLITVDLGCEVGDEIWKMDDERLATVCLDKLKPLIPDIANRYLGVRVLRTPIAYPIFLRQYEEERRAFQQSTGIRGLYSIGRNGEFDHLLTEDVYWRTLSKMAHSLPALKNPLWPDEAEPELLRQSAANS
jgi:oxygen-dependent protoporphyrinogen oxidase